MDCTANSHDDGRERNLFLYVDEQLLHIAMHQNMAPNAPGWRNPGQAPSPLMQLHAALDDFARSRSQRSGERFHEPLQRRFEVIARTTPCATAVSFNGRCLNYGDLDEQADALALHLQARGLAPCSFCVVDLEPSLAQVRAILAILKAGAVWLQIDARLGPRAVAAVLAALAPAFRVSRGAGQGGIAGAALTTVYCDEDAADLPYGWADEIPVGARTLACANATLAPDGNVCIDVRTHRALGELLDQAPLVNPQQVTGLDPGGLWRPLSRGTPLTIRSQVVQG